MSRLLVDTHAVLWWLADDPALPAAARDAIADPANAPLVSTATLWEIAIKRSLGKLEVPDDLPGEIDSAGFTWLAVDERHAWEVRNLPRHHRDPFDRLLIAQAGVEDVPVVTGDDRFASYSIDIVW